MKSNSWNKWRSYSSRPLTSSPPLWRQLSGNRPRRKPPYTGRGDRPPACICTRCLCMRLCRALGQCGRGKQWRGPDSLDHSWSSDPERKNESKWSVYSSMLCVKPPESSLLDKRVFGVCLMGLFLQVSWAAAVDRAVDGFAVLNLAARWRQTSQNIQFETFTTLINRWCQSGVQVVTKSYSAGEKWEATEPLGLVVWLSSVGLPHKPVSDWSGPGRWEN